MKDTLSYAQALSVLGAKKTRLVSFLDAIASTGLTVWAASMASSGGDVGVPLGLYELKNDIVGYAHAIVQKVSEWRSGLSRFDRTQRLSAAHSIIVVSSYFETLDFSNMLFDLHDLKLSRNEQAALATGSASSGGYVGMIQMLLHEPLPMPEPHRTYQAARDDIKLVYDRLGDQLFSFVSDLEVVKKAVKDAVDEAVKGMAKGPAKTAREKELTGGQWQHIRDAITGSAGPALNQYDASYRRLAADNHEFMVWASLTEAHALGAGLARISELLAAMSVSRSANRTRSHMAKDYRAALQAPILASEQAPEGVVLPPLSKIYINPQCRIAEIGPEDAPALHEWWEGNHKSEAKKLITDIERYLIGYLTSRRATQAPLVVLGEPGSGKSKLTQVLAARLCDGDFLPIRVQLRDVAAESMISQQVEQAILLSLGDHVDWHDLVESADEKLPVVLLDGFDEMLQAGNMNRYDYLEQAKNFQRQQTALGHPVAIIVTSRTVVADHVRFPPGSLGMRLQPFTDDQIRRWLDVWNVYNSAPLKVRHLTPMTLRAALGHRELAEQPLLLLMLAIFDATDNAVQRGEAAMGSAELYRALLMDFALREIRKYRENRALPAVKQQELAERELQRLAVVALAMFARNRQHVSDTELNLDLPILFPEHDGDSTPAEKAVSHFFFIYRSEARKSGERLRSYEFLHLTFSEFLVAWLAVRALRDLAELRERSTLNVSSTAFRARLDDGFLYAILSFRCLATSASAEVVNFLHQLVLTIPPDDRERCRSLIYGLLAEAFHPHPGRSHHDYEPKRNSFPKRIATYSANLVLLLVLVAEEPIVLSDVFGDDHPLESWHEHAHLWKGMLSLEEWDGLLATIRAQRSNEEIILVRESGGPLSLTTHLLTAPAPVPGLRPEDYNVSIPPTSVAGIALRESLFLGNWHEELILLDFVPFIRACDGWLLGAAGDPIGAPAYLLGELDYSRGADPQKRTEIYLRCFDLLERYGSAIRSQLLLRLQEDIKILDPQIVYDLLSQAEHRGGGHDHIYRSAVNEFWDRSRRRESKTLALRLRERIQGVGGGRVTSTATSLDDHEVSLEY